MPVTRLQIECSGSAFLISLGDAQRWKTVLDCADAIALRRNGVEQLRVQLGGLRRWIAFERLIGGSPLYAIGWQETIGVEASDGGYITTGSNRKMIAFLHPDGRVAIE